MPLDMTGLIVGIFAVVYLGMILGGLPLLQLDRTGVALLGAIALIGLDSVSGSISSGIGSRRSRVRAMEALYSEFLVPSEQCCIGDSPSPLTRRSCRRTGKP